jgi:hypothetical protein
MIDWFCVISELATFSSYLVPGGLDQALLREEWLRLYDILILPMEFGRTE